MLQEEIDIGSAPVEEKCAQVGTEGYETRAFHECRAYIALLRRTIGREPPGCRLRVKRNPHDFGTYLSVVCSYDAESKDAADYAERCDGKAPTTWDDEARAELAKKENGGGQ